MKRLIAAIALSLAMTGCATQETRQVRAIVTTEEQYVDTMRERSDTFDEANETELVAAGKGVCDYFVSHGVTKDSVSVLIGEFAMTFSPKDTSLILSESVEAFCPDKTDSVQDVLLNRRSV